VFPVAHMAFTREFQSDVLIVPDEVDAGALADPVAVDAADELLAECRASVAFGDDELEQAVIAAHSAAVAVTMPKVARMVLQRGEGADQCFDRPLTALSEQNQRESADLLEPYT